MIKKFSQYIQNQFFFKKNKTTLIATSGGIDSVVLCYLFHHAALSFAIAHCNFKLRNEESDKDDFFVKQLAQQLQVPFFSIAFDTKIMAKERQQSIQLAARELRYEWLQQIAQENNFQYIATAHHLNDSIETVLYNFAKGCGIRGLHGILPIQNNIIRPLLFATKEEILAFAQKENISFREDASNASDKYNRNKIRHHVVPVLKQINENFEQTAAGTIERIKETEALYDWAIGQIKEKLIAQENPESFQIKIKELLAQVAPNSILYEILKPFGFRPDVVAQILERIKVYTLDKENQKQQAGLLFFSKSHRLLIDRKYLVIEPIPKANATILKIEKPNTSFTLDGQQFSLEMLPKPPTHFPNNQKIAFLDLAQLQFPLTLRHWQPGDYFQPLGMKGKHQKLQDFFSNQKLSRFEKEKIWLLVSEEKICWVMGYRIDERFKITKKTNQVLRISLT